MLNKQAIIRERIISAVIGGAVGDALGVPVEFEERDSFKVEDMIEGGTHEQPAGSWSDDTSLTLCLVENIIEGGTPETLMKKFSDWEEKDYMTSNGECFGCGHITWAAIETFRKGTPAAECGGAKETDNGNGSLMRIAPLVFLNLKLKDFKSRLANVEKYSAITHAHPRAVLGCIIYTEYLRQLCLLAKDKAEVKYVKYKALAATIKICKKEISDAKYKDEFPHYSRILSSIIINEKRESIQSDGYVVHTLEAALWCFLKNDNFKDTVLTAVNLGDDTDTIATVAGTMAGMFYTRSYYEGIPEEWIDKLAKIDFIKKLCYKFIQTLEPKNTYEHYLKEVKKNGFTFEFVPEEFKTQELCIEAIKADCISLRIIPKPPEKLGEEDNEAIDGVDMFSEVTECNTMLKFVPEALKTAELCFTAVKRENQMKKNSPTPEGFEEVNQNLKYVPEAININEAFKRIDVAFQSLGNKFKELVDMLVEENKKSEKEAEDAI